MDEERRENEDEEVREDEDDEDEGVDRVQEQPVSQFVC